MGDFLFWYCFAYGIVFTLVLLAWLFLLMKAECCPPKEPEVAWPTEYAVLNSKSEAINPHLTYNYDKQFETYAFKRTTQTVSTALGRMN